jgi:hypothetical protein
MTQSSALAPDGNVCAIGVAVASWPAAKVSDTEGSLVRRWVTGRGVWICIYYMYVCMSMFACRTYQYTVISLRRAPTKGRVTTSEAEVVLITISTVGVIVEECRRDRARGAHVSFLRYLDLLPRLIFLLSSSFVSIHHDSQCLKS